MNFVDDFDAERTKRVTLAEAGTRNALIWQAKKDERSQVKNKTNHCSRARKMKHMMSWTRLDVYNSVKDYTKQMKIMTKENNQEILK